MFWYVHFRELLLNSSFMSTTPNECELSLVIKHRFVSTNATSSTFWWLEITSKAPRLEMENYLGLSSQRQTLSLRNLFYQVAKILICLRFCSFSFVWHSFSTLTYWELQYVLEHHFSPRGQAEGTYLLGHQYPKSAFALFPTSKGESWAMRDRE